MTTMETLPVGNTFQELILQSKLTELFVKSCSRHNLAVRMVCEPFDEETWINLVHMGGKKQVEP